MQYDIAIVGGGFVGLTLAHALNTYGFKSILFDTTEMTTANINVNAKLLHKNENNGNKVQDQYKDPDKDTNQYQDKDHDKDENINLDNRGIALSNTSIQILSMLNIWQKLQQDATPIKCIHISQGGSFGRIKLLAQKYNMEQFGSVVCADLLLKNLQQSSQNLPNVKTLFATKIKSLAKQRECGTWKIKCKTNDTDLNNETAPKNDTNHKNETNPKNDTDANANIAANDAQEIEVTAKLLIAADGVNSFVRNFAQIDVIKHDYNKSALVFNILLEETHNNIAYERFHGDTTLALVPFQANYYKCILIVPNNAVQQYLEYPKERLKNILYKIIGGRIGKIKKLGKIINYPLIKTMAKELYKEDLVLIGNAANTIHPVAAQGLNLGLRDVATLVEVLHASKNNSVSSANSINTTFNTDNSNNSNNSNKDNKDNTNQINPNHNILEHYSKLRKLDHTQTANFADNIVKLFDLNIQPIPFLRNFGLTVAGVSSTLQQLLVKEGLGTNKPLPKLARGIEL